MSLERVMPCEKSDGARASTTLNCGTEPVLRSLNGRCGRVVALVLFLTYWLLLCVPAGRRELGNGIEIEVEAMRYSEQHASTAIQRRRIQSQADDAPPTPASLPAASCFTTSPSDFILDLAQSTVLHSNLGGFTAGVPPALRFANVGVDPATGRAVDLEVTNNTLYQPWNSTNNGLASGGRIGQINLEATHQGEDPDRPRYVDLVFSFVDSATIARRWC